MPKCSTEQRNTFTGYFVFHISVLTLRNSFLITNKFCTVETPSHCAMKDDENIHANYKVHLHYCWCKVDASIKTKSFPSRTQWCDLLIFKVSDPECFPTIFFANCVAPRRSSTWSHDWSLITSDKIASRMMVHIAQPLSEDHYRAAIDRMHFSYQQTSKCRFLFSLRDHECTKSASRVPLRCDVLQRIT